MREKIIAANWKMNGSQGFISSWLAKFKQINKVKPIVFPPAVYIDQVARVIKADNINLAYGAQNINANLSGAHTGEISASMVNEFGCGYVLIGHSESRALYAETNESLREKLIAAKNNHLIPIFCVGESLKEYESGETHDIISRQLDAADGFDHLVLAYEPIWAIGTGKAATAEHAQAAHGIMRSRVGKDVSILYGGSVKPSNAAEFFEMPDIDGALVGGASLNVEDFMDIIKCMK